MKLKSLAFAAAVVCGASLVALGMVAPAADNDCCSITEQPLTLSELRSQPGVLARPATARDVVMHVDGMRVTWVYAGGAKRRPGVAVRVVDSAGTPVYGATVTGDWSGCFKKTNESGVTGDLDLNGDGMITVDEQGWATWYSSRTATCTNSRQCNFIFTVTNVSLAGSSYDPNQNMITTSSVMCNWVI